MLNFCPALVFLTPRSTHSALCPASGLLLFLLLLLFFGLFVLLGLLVLFVFFAFAWFPVPCRPDGTAQTHIGSSVPGSQLIVLTVLMDPNGSDGSNMF